MDKQELNDMANTMNQNEQIREGAPVHPDPNASANAIINGYLQDQRNDVNPYSGTYKPSDF